MTSVESCSHSRGRAAARTPQQTPTDKPDKWLSSPPSPFDLMANKTYRGSCHCGKVTFEVEIDLSKGTGKCNCSICWKAWVWSINIKPDAFRTLTGRDELTEYTFGTKQAHHMFCKHLRRSSVWRHIEQIGGDYVAINLACLDDLDPAELVTAPVPLFDGKEQLVERPGGDTPLGVIDEVRYLLAALRSGSHTSRAPRS